MLASAADAVGRATGGELQVDLARAREVRCTVGLHVYIHIYMYIYAYMPTLVYTYICTYMYI